MVPILHVLTSGSWGGLEMYVTSLIKAQAERGDRVSAFVLSNTNCESELREAGVPVHIAERHAHVHLPDIRAIRRIMQAEKFGLVHSHTSRDIWPSSLAVLGTRNAHVTSVYVNAMPKRDPHHWFIYRRVDAVISSANETNERLRRSFPLPPDRVHLVRYGRHLEHFVRQEAEREAMRAKFGLLRGEYAFGIMGRIEPAKGTREFAESLLQLDPAIRQKVKYLIIGARSHERGEYYQWVQDFAARLDVREHVRIIPWDPNPVPYLSALDALVMASHCEMYSLSVLEAMAMSLPVIGTNSGGTTEQIGANERGLLVEPKNPRSIADAITRYVNSPSLLLEHGAAANAWVRCEHSMERSLDALEDVYRIALRRRKAPGALSAETISEKASATALP